MSQYGYKEIFFEKHARKEFKSLPLQIKRIFSLKIDELSEIGFLEYPDARKLEWEFFEIRVICRGYWRAIYAYHEDIIVILSVFNKKTNELEHMANIGVVDSNGALIMNPEVKQGYNEYSNVSLEREFMGMMPIKRNFDANRQIFMLQSQNLTKAISQLGSAS